MKIPYAPRFFCALAIFGSMLLTSCGEPLQTVEEAVMQNAYTGPESMETIAVLDYSIPYQNANVVVDRAGYCLSGSKTAYVIGAELPAAFAVVEDATGAKVYEGMLEPVNYEGSTDNGVAAARFGDLQTSGTYHIECEQVGHSYSFGIESDYYAGHHGRAMAQLEDACRAQSETPVNMLYLLQSVEWNSAIYQDGNGDNIPDALNVAAQWITGIDYDALPEAQVTEYVAVLSKFSYLYRNYNVKLATECLQKAASLYNQSKSVLTSDAMSFWSLTELYRASGQYTYREEIADYMTYFSNHTGYMDQEGYLYGAMTYMMTRQKVDTDLCTVFMNDMLGSAEEIGNRKKEMLTPGIARNNGEADLLLCAQKMICANYVLEGVQYNEMLEEIMHYLSGCNTTSVTYELTDSNRGRYLLLYGWLNRLEQDGLIKDR